MHDVIVVGGGASGMMAAGRAAERGKRVLLLEKNRRLGEKVRISGGGRCNITNAEEDEHALLRHYGKASQFLYSTFSQFSMRDTFRFFEARGVPLKVEERLRAFPVSERASDVCAALETYLRDGEVEVKIGLTVERIETSDGRVSGIVAGGRTYQALSYILATGGLSHPETGSTGDGFSWLSSLGHSIAPPSPTIVPLKTKETWVRRLAGVSIPVMKITFFANGARRFSRTGPLLFTHMGLSGPTILNAAAAVADLLHEGVVTARVDTQSECDLGALDSEFVALFDAHKNKTLRNVFGEIAPRGTADVLLSLVPHIDPSTKVHSVTKEERRTLAHLLKGIPLAITGLLGFDKAVIADGGLPLGEIDTKTMRSKRIKNLFVTGDLLHIARPSGGYSLQLCWTTGYVAGNNA